MAVHVDDVRGSAWGQFTDGINVEFGKNRVQYRTFEWQNFEQGLFEVYHYREVDQIAGQVARILEEEAKDLGTVFGRTLEGPDSGVGLQIARGIPPKQRGHHDVPRFGNQHRWDGTTRGKQDVPLRHRRPAPAGTRRPRRPRPHSVQPGDVRQPMDGEPAEWQLGASAGVDVRRRRPLRGAWARCREREPHPRRLPNRAPSKRLDQSAGLEAAVLGQAVWAYVADIYGMPTIANVLYMTRITRSVESGVPLGHRILSWTIWPRKCGPITCGTPHVGTKGSLPPLGKPQGQANG